MKNGLRSIAVIAAGALLCSLAASAQVSVTTYHNDNSRTGQNIHETVLTTKNVKVSSFGKLYTSNVTLDSWAVAQPLYVANVTIGGILHNVVYVATLNNSVYAFDADSGTELWMQNYGPVTPFAGLCHDPLYDTSPSGGAGIVGTPVIDPVAGTIYFVTKTGNGTASSPYGLYLHAVDFTTGIDKTGSPQLINPTSGPKYHAEYQMNRPALLLSNGNVYVALGSTGCVGIESKAFPVINNHGYVFGFNTSNLTAAPTMFITTPVYNNGGIWQSGGGLVADGNGNIYFETANGNFDYNIGGFDFGDSVLELNANLDFVDFFTPYNADTLLYPDDLDPSAVGPVLVPNSTAGGPANLLIASGKTEEMWVLNPADMGGFCSTCTTATSNTNIVQEVPRAPYLSGCQTPPPGGVFTCRHGSLAYWNNTVFVPGVNAPLMSYSLSNGLLNTTPLRAAAAYPTVNGPSISANGSTNGIVWLITETKSPVNFGVLRAYNAVTLAPLYYSISAKDSLGQVAHFVTPTVANGKVFVATRTQLVVYGLE